MDNSVCAIDGCGRKLYAKGLCSVHYQEQRRRGSVCIVNRCQRTVMARELCPEHYRRLMKYGDPNGGRSRREAPPRNYSLREAFEWYRPGMPPEEGVVWPWLGHTQYQGYGTIRHHKVLHVAHRLSYELFVGPIPDGLVVRHKNDTPIDVNPNNLEIGTCADNTADIWDRERGNPPRGEINGQAKLTDNDVLEIRALRAAGISASSLGRRYGMAASTIRNICSRRSWRHLP